MQEKITFDKVARWTGIALIIISVLLLMNYLSSVLLPFFVAWLLAYLLYPLVAFVERKLHIRYRVVSIIITVLAVTIAIAGALYFIIPPMIEQFAKLAQYITAWLHQTAQTDDLSTYIQRIFKEHEREINEFLHSNDFNEAVKTVVPQLFNFLGQTVNVILSIVAAGITLLYMFFILLDYEYLTNNWIRIFPLKARPFWRNLMQDVSRELNNYIRGQSLVALTMGILFCIGFTIMDFPMAIGLGILIGVMDLVPYLHTFALIPTAFLAMLKAADTGQNFWLVFGLAVGLFALVQVIIDMIVTPKIMGKAMGLNPAILLLSLSVWGSLLGFIGLIVALPLTTILMAYWQRYITREHLAEAALTETTATEEEANQTTEKKKTAE